MKKLLLSLSTLFFLNGNAGNPNTALSPKNQLVSSPTVAGEALNFDGVDDYVVASPYSGLAEYTIEAWVKLNNLNDQNIILATDNNGPTVSVSHNLRLIGGKFEHYLWDGSARIVTSPNVIFAGTWYHVAITAKNSGKMSIVVNNTETKSTFNIGNIWSLLTKFRFGGNTPSYGCFNGEMDEVRIWNRQLCSEEITNNMNGEIATSATNLLGNYHFNQGTAGSANASTTTLTDASGYSKNGTLTNFSLTGTTSNWVSPGAVTPGSSVTPYVRTNISVTPPAVACSGVQYTVSASGADTYYWSNGVTSQNLILMNSNPSPTAYSYTVTGYNANGCASNPAVATYTVYTNPTITIPTGYICNGTSYTINPSGATNYSFSSGSSVVSPSVNSSFTVSGANSYGCVSSSNATVYVQACGQSGSSLSFDGINDVVNTPVTYTLGNNWTFECWAKSPYSPVTNNGYDGPMYGTNMAIVWNHATTTFKGSASVQSSNGNFYAASYGQLLPETWYHLAATYDGTVLCAYKNGVLTTSVTTAGGITAPTGNLMFGRHPSNANFWEGTMDEARVWTTTRTCAEINQYMNTELTGNEAGLKAYYNFNEGTPMGSNTSVTSLLDKTSNGLNASVSNFALTGNSSNFFLGAPFDVTPSCGVATGLKELTNNLNISVYPNPANSFVNIEVSQPTTISIINVLGDVMKTETINEIDKVDVSNLTSGIYFIKDVKSGKAIKFIKE